MLCVVKFLVFGCIGGVFVCCFLNFLVFGFSVDEKLKYRVFFFMKFVGFEYDVVKWKGDELVFVECVFVEFGKKYGFEVMVMKDGCVFDGDIFVYDVFFFYIMEDFIWVGNDKNFFMS